MAASDDVVIISACRTPVGKFQGSLSDLSAPQLGAIVVREAVQRAKLDPKQVDECIMGNVVSAGLGQNPARQAAIFGGLPPEVGAMTVNKVCGSGLKAVGLAAQAVKTGDSSIVVAGGMESMTNAPYLLPQARKGYHLGNAQIIDSMVHDGLWDIYNNYHMGITGENVAEKYGITREEQDEFALNSHRKAVAATNGIDPKWVMMAPVSAVRKIWQKTGWKNEDVDLYELNEAFSVQALGVMRELGLDPNKVNVNGGAVAIGHPIGASGARVLVTLIYEMIRRDVQKGVAALCLGGGNSVAMAVER